MDHPLEGGWQEDGTFNVQGMTEVSPFILNESDTVLVQTTPEGLVSYSIIKTAEYRAEMADAFGAGSPEATQPASDVALTETFMVTAGGYTQTLWDFTGKPEGFVSDEREGDVLSAND